MISLLHYPTSRALRSLPVGVVIAVACSGVRVPGGVSAPAPDATPASADTLTVFPGIDLRTYPGDDAMRAWRYPSSPYHWVGAYLSAPCHRDSSFVGKLGSLRSSGWGVAVIYVGQQDWSQVPASSVPQAQPSTTTATAADSAAATPRPVLCSAALLTADRGKADAADAVAKAGAEGLPNQSLIFLDVERVRTVSPALTAYFRAWIDGVLQDGRYRPAVYVAKANAPELYVQAADAFRAVGDSTRPMFWIAGRDGFSLSQSPTAVGFEYAGVWQGVINTTESYNGVRLGIDVNVASRRSPSTP